MFLERLQGRWPNHLSGQLLYTAYHRHRCYMISPQEAFPRSFYICCDRRYAKLCWEKEVKTSRLVQWREQEYQEIKSRKLPPCAVLLILKPFPFQGVYFWISSNALVMDFLRRRQGRGETYYRASRTKANKEENPRYKHDEQGLKKKIFKFCSLLHVLLNSRGRLATLIPYPRTSTTITANGIDLMKSLLS